MFNIFNSPSSSLDDSKTWGFGLLGTGFKMRRMPQVSTSTEYKNTKVPQQ